ncbi:hypothetical protein ACFQ51_32840 [Streptomyces kaempferi]
MKRANRSSREFVEIFEALGVLDARTEADMAAAIEERKDNTPPAPPNEPRSYGPWT